MHTTTYRPLLLAALLGLASFATAQDESPLLAEHIRAVREQYRVETWPQGRLRDGLTLGTLALPGWEGEALRARSGWLTRGFRAPSESAATFVVEARVGASAQEAHEVLVTWLAGMSSTRPAPDTRGHGRPVGDAGYIGFSGAARGAVSWVAFVRGNVAVRVTSRDPRRTPELDVIGLAQRLDQTVLARTALAPGASLPRPAIVEFSAPESAAGPAPIPLDVRVVGSDAQDVHRHWIVAGTGQGYVEQAETGAWRFHPTGPGRVDLTQEATGATGTFTSGTIRIEVADD